MTTQPITVRNESPRRGRGRPRAFETERVLEAALELFWTEGYRTTTTRTLETALGLSQSSIYNTFGSKKKLLDAALDRYETLTDRALLQPLERATEGLASVDCFFVALARWVTQDGKSGCMLINMMAEDGGSTACVTQRTRRYRERVREGLRQGLGRAASLGEIENDGLDDRADLLVGLVLGLNIAARGRASQDEQSRLLAAVRSQLRSWKVALS